MLEKPSRFSATYIVWTWNIQLMKNCKSICWCVTRLGLWIINLRIHTTIQKLVNILQCVHSLVGAKQDTDDGICHSTLWIDLHYELIPAMSRKSKELEKPLGMSEECYICISGNRFPNSFKVLDKRYKREAGRTKFSWKKTPIMYSKLQISYCLATDHYKKEHVD